MNQPATATITAEALNTAVAWVPTASARASTPSWVTLAVMADPPGKVSTTSDEIAPFSTRETVPASWLRADS